MREKTKRCLGMLLSLVLALSMCPTTGFADDAPVLDPEGEPTPGPVVNSVPVEMDEETGGTVEAVAVAQGAPEAPVVEQSVDYLNDKG